MENQHRQISGYRELSQAEIDLMNKIKALGPQIEAVTIDMKATTGFNVDPRWLNIGITHLQQGLMALTRAVAKPTFF